MVTINLPEAVAERLEKAAQSEHRDIGEFITLILDERLETEQDRATPDSNGIGPDWDSLIGIIDSHISDASTTARETLRAIYEKKYGNSD